MNERFIVCASGNGDWPVYYNASGGWWGDMGHATHFKTRDEAEQAAFMAVAADPDLSGGIEVIATEV